MDYKRMEPWEIRAEIERRQPVAVKINGETEWGRQFLEDPLTEEVVKVQYDIAEVKRRGGRTVFRFGGYEFRTLAAAAQYRFDLLVSESPFKRAPSIEGRTREKTPGECATEIKEAISEVEPDLVSKLTSALSRPGAWREILIGDDTPEKREHMARSREDLTDRLTDVFGNSLTLLLISKIMPDLFRKAVESLPPGQTEKDIWKEEEESDRRDRERRSKEIAEAKGFLKQILKGKV